MRVDAFDFELPAERIALRPVVPRDSARLLSVSPACSPPFRDCSFQDLPGLLGPGDLLVFNDTRVIPARLFGVRQARDELLGEPRDEGPAGPGISPGARIEVLLHQRLDETRWKAFARPAKKLKPDDRLLFGAGATANLCLASGLAARVLNKGEAGEVTLGFEMAGPVLDEAIALHGSLPLPPYIASKRDVDARDLADYQTIYAARDGAVAAPTAGLHFTRELLEKIDKKNIERLNVTLHVGAGTFLPVKAQDTQDHRMHGETGVISQEAADRINACRARGGRVIAVGTTALRLLEASCDKTGKVHAFNGETGIFITPGYRFGAVDGLITNFHLPRSTLFMLVSAFCGLEVMQSAYQHAIKQHYRFYSYGDASFLLKGVS